jgi:ABC-2 type transport system ATP-binding protein
VIATSSGETDGAGASTVVEVETVLKSYGEKRVLKGPSFSVRRGEIFGLLGPNGAGKSTLLESIVGLREIDSGSITVLDHEPVRDREFITSHVSVQPQSASLFDSLTVEETLRLYASFHAAPRGVREVITEIGLVEQTAVRSQNLSGGQTRRLLLGVALIGDPEIVVLDEPSAGLDPQAKQGLLAVIRSLRDRGVTILFSTHDMQEATQICDRVAILVNGTLRALDSPAELVRKSGSVSAVSFVVERDTDLATLREAINVETFEASNVTDGLKVEITTDDPDSVMRAVTFRSGIKARDFTVSRSTLENYFLDLVSTASAAERGALTDKGR